MNSLFTAALIGGMIVPDLTFRTTIGNLGYEKMTFPNPVFHGDTLRAESTILKQARVQEPDGRRHRLVRAPRLQPERRARSTCATAPA